MEVPSTSPSPPMKLMMPLAWERSLFGVTSGMSATTGVRQKAIARMVVTVQATNKGESWPEEPDRKRARQSRANQMKGWRLPSLVRSRSDHAPTGG